MTLICQREREVADNFDVNGQPPSSSADGRPIEGLRPEPSEGDRRTTWRLGSVQAGAELATAPAAEQSTRPTRLDPQQPPPGPSSEPDPPAGTQTGGPPSRRQG